MKASRRSLGGSLRCLRTPASATHGHLTTQGRGGRRGGLRDGTAAPGGALVWVSKGLMLSLHCTAPNGFWGPFFKKAQTLGFVDFKMWFHYPAAPRPTVGTSLSRGGANVCSWGFTPDLQDQRRQIPPGTPDCAFTRRDAR